MTQRHDDDAGRPQPSAPESMASSHGPSGQFLLTIGDIGVTPDWVVTPNGTARLAGSQWIVRDMSRTETSIPAYAIVLAVVFFLLCFVGLLFLLIKETKTVGYVEVSVQAGDLFHVTQLPVSSQHNIAQIRALVHQAQALTAAAR
jgi:hypothetical protein